MEMRFERSAQIVPTQQLRGWAAYCEAVRLLESEHAADHGISDTHHERSEGARVDEE